MRVVECNICGEAISAASDDELVGRVTDHLESEHDEEPETEEIEGMVAEQAYEAMDSWAPLRRAADVRAQRPCRGRRRSL